jgi:hypothetical protein
LVLHAIHSTTDHTMHRHTHTGVGKAVERAVEWVSRCVTKSDRRIYIHTHAPTCAYTHTHAPCISGVGRV